MSISITLFFILIASCAIFYLTTCLPIHGKDSELNNHNDRRSEIIRRRNKQLYGSRYFRRQGVSTRIIPFFPWKVKNPEHLWTVRTTKATSRIYYNLTRERCDYMRFRCMKAYRTGAVCARTVDYIYFSFRDYCALDFHNCLSRLDAIWSIAYMGYCTALKLEKELYVDMTYDQMSNNSKLTQMYIADAGDETEFEAYATYYTSEVTESTAPAPFEYQYVNFFDEDGSTMLDDEGNVVTDRIRVTIVYYNVTDENKNLVLDEHGIPVTVRITTTTEATTTTASTKKAG
ncbi:uncharacterized protein LOC125238411 [Leguminivora glycinivorella]|uniref:uncharacterized protein LOC125238411 n=1 Tax=Leguminivora glycinivorella TaxID=1035111 RepID=UPI00200E7BAB|nr:uncharacterized protein LOC125238411 [Leguminivora glycinivorella]